MNDDLAKSAGASARTSSDRPGVILFAHGARDPRWAEPFERLREKVAARLDPAGDGTVALAFLEMMQPDLDQAAASLLAAGCRRLVIVPIFFGQGAHLRRDLPLLVEALRARHADVAITVADAAGENDAVLTALAGYCASAVVAPVDR